jgi:hypothetical protein
MLDRKLSCSLLLQLLFVTMARLFPDLLLLSQSLCVVFRLFLGASGTL